MVTVLAAILGGLLRLLFGGAPHYPNVVAPTSQNPGLFPRWLVYVLFLILGCVAAVPAGSGLSVADRVAALTVALVLAAGWGITHGAYLSPGAGNADTRWLQYFVRPVAKLAGWTDGSVGYCCLGMSIRYGLQTALAAGAGLWAGSSVSWAYGLVGLLAGPVMWLCWKAGWGWVTAGLKPWLGPQFNNGPFEIAVGALLYGGLALLA